MSQPPNIRYFFEPAADDPHARFPCGTCQRVVGERNKAIQCEVLVRRMGHALLGNAFHSLFETDLGSLVCGLKRVIDRFLKKSPQMPFWALFCPGGQNRGSKRGNNC